jgi:hypothetical protein
MVIGGRPGRFQIKSGSCYSSVRFSCFPLHFPPEILMFYAFAGADLLLGQVKDTLKPGGIGQQQTLLPFLSGG